MNNFNIDMNKFQLIIAYMNYHNLSFKIERRNMLYYFEADFYNTHANTMKGLIDTIFNDLNLHILDINLSGTWQ